MVPTFFYDDELTYSASDEGCIGAYAEYPGYMDNWMLQSAISIPYDSVNGFDVVVPITMKGTSLPKTIYVGLTEAVNLKQNVTIVQAYCRLFSCLPKRSSEFLALLYHPIPDGH